MACENEEKEYQDALKQLQEVEPRAWIGNHGEMSKTVDVKITVLTEDQEKAFDELLAATENFEAKLKARINCHRAQIGE